MILKLAWRNLWRNKRRTIITASSILFGVFIAIITRAVQLGTYDYMLNSFIKKFSGDIQIQNENYFRNPSYKNFLTFNDSLKKILASNKNLSGYSPRIQAFGIVKKGNKYKNCFIYAFYYENEKNSFYDPNLAILKFKIDSSASSFIDDTSKLKNLIGLYRSQNEIIHKLENLKLDTSLVQKLVKPIKYNLIENQIPQNSVYIGYKLAENLKIKVYDTIELIIKDAEGNLNLKKFQVLGLLKLPNYQLNKSAIYMDINSAEKLIFHKTNNSNIKISYIAINTVFKVGVEKSELKKIQNIIDTLNSKLPKNLVAIGWKDLNKDVKQQIESDNISGQIILMIIYLVIGFGIFGTVIMMFNERIKEFAILIAIGTKKIKLITTFILEMLIIAFIGVIFGEILGFGVIKYFSVNPIKFTGELSQIYETFNFEPVVITKPYGQFMIWQAVVILAITLIISLYPIVKISKLKFVNAIRK